MQSTTANRHGRHHHDISTAHPNPKPTPDPPKPNPRLLSLLLKSVIMILITFLFFIFLSIASLVVAQFFLAGGHALRRRNRSRRPATPSEIQRSLPPFRYDAVPGGDEEDCAVCLEVFGSGERCRVLPNCGHVFHAGCVDAWLVRRDNCPVCRASVRIDLGSSGSALGDDDCKFFWAVGV